MSMFRCWHCDKTVDSDIDNAGEIDGKMSCEDCIVSKEEENE